MKKLLLFSMAIVMALSACEQNNKALMYKVGEKLYYDVMNFSSDTVRKIEMITEVIEVTDTTETTSYTYIFADSGQKISDTYTSSNTKEESEVSIKSIFTSHLMPYSDSLEFVDGDKVVIYKNNIDEKTVLEPARMLLKSKAEGKDVMIELSVEERNVYGKETVTTPAGIFECIKSSENHVAKIGDEEFFMQQISWYDCKEGTEVRQTNCSKNGDVIYEVVLTKIEQPL